MAKKERVNQKLVTMSELAVLTALILLMAFTPVGYIKTAGLEITLITIPVIVGAIVIGPAGGAFLGGVFGLTSFLQCVMGLSAFGATLLSINPVYTFLVTFPTRLLMGLFTGLVWKLWKKKSVAAYSVTSLVGALTNTVLFMSTLVIFFYHTEFIQSIVTSVGATNVISFVVAFVGINGLVEAITCFIIAGAISKVTDAAVARL